MVDWKSLPEIQQDALVFQKFMLVLLGISAWEIFTQFPYDWSLITRRRHAQWPVVIYEYCKYSVFFAILCVNLSLNITTKVDCQSLYVFNQFAGNTSIGSSSTLLMLRALAIWNRKVYITAPLVLLSLGQWAILFHGIATVKSKWDPVSQTCVVYGTKAVFITLIYLYTMSFDFIVLIVSSIGLVRNPGRSSLWSLIFRQGIIYFVVAFLSNLIAAIFLLLDLNPIMNIMFAVPSALASAIVATRSFKELAEYKSDDVYVHSSTTRRGAPRADGSGNTGPIRGAKGNGPVHISMDSYATPSTATYASPNSHGTLSSATVDSEREGKHAGLSQEFTNTSDVVVDLEHGHGPQARSYPPEL